MLEKSKDCDDLKGGPAGRILKSLRIKNSVMRVTVWHHEACRLMPSDGIFNSHQTTIIDSFSCILFLR